MSIVRIKNPESGLWEVLEVGAVTGRASTQTYGVIKYGDSLTLNEYNQLVTDGELVFYGPEEPTEDFYGIWIDTDEDYDVNDMYHPDWDCDFEDSASYILHRETVMEPLSLVTTQANNLRKDVGMLEELQVEAENLVDSDNALNQRAAALEGRATSLENRVTSTENRITVVEGRLDDAEGRLDDLIHIGTDTPSDNAVIWLDLSDEEE